MYKGLVSEIAREVGKSAALILNQIYQWFKSQKVEKVYRTNAELKEDLCGILSTATIQRAKQKLVDKGYIIVSFDKGLNRTTHFVLTEKAKNLLAPVNQKVVASQPAPKKQNSYSSKQKSVGQADENLPETAKELFKEAGTKREGIVRGIPDALKKLIGIKGEKKQSTPVEQKVKELQPLPPVVADEEFFGVSAFQEKVDEVDMSDEEYFGVTPEQWIAIDIANGQPQAPTESVNFNDLMNSAFNRIPNVDIREKNREMLNASQYFREDY